MCCLLHPFFLLVASLLPGPGPPPRSWLGLYCWRVNNLTINRKYAPVFQVSSGWELKHGYVETICATLPSTLTGAVSATDAPPSVLADNLFVKLAPTDSRSSGDASRGEPASGVRHKRQHKGGGAPGAAAAGGPLALEGGDAGGAPINDSIQRIAGTRAQRHLPARLAAKTTCLLRPQKLVCQHLREHCPVQ